MSWPVTLRFLHWLTTALLAAQSIVAFGPMKGPGMASMLWMPYHISIGVFVLFATLTRLALRFFTSAPNRRLSPFVQVAANLIHWSLYAVVAAIIVTGWLAYRPMPLMAPARVFGYFRLPQPPSFADWSARDFTALHSMLFWVFAALVTIHILAALVHAIVLRDSILSGMLFRRSRE